MRFLLSLVEWEHVMKISRAMRNATCLVGIGLALMLGSASRAAESDQVPQPTADFKGVIGKTYKESTPAWPEIPKAAENAPNVLIVLLDDVGFGQPSTFGGLIPTP